MKEIVHLRTTDGVANMKWIRICVITFVSLSAVALGVFFVLPLPHQQFARLEVGNTSLMVEVVDTPARRTQGLSDRLQLPSQNGMLFVFDTPAPYGIWMRNMKFPLDILWIRNGVVVDIKENAPAPSPATPEYVLPVFKPDMDADLVLEVNAGFAARHHVTIGTRVMIHGEGAKTSQKAFAETARAETAGAASEKTNPPGTEFTIPHLRLLPPQGKNFTIGNLLAQNEAYKKYAITYRSGDLIVSGVMNVPQGPGAPFPVLILNHGLIAADAYISGRGSKREQDFFARHGYVTIHPDYRGLGASSPNPALHHDFYVGYTQDVLALIDALKGDAPQFLDPSHIGMWGHSMGGGIAARAMVLIHDVRAFVVFAPISADAEGNFYELKPEEITWLRSAYGPAGADIYRAISPIKFFSDVSSPVQLHHGTADIAVPQHFSEDMFRALVANGKRVELFLYPGEKHEFIEQWSLAAERARQFFDQYVKNAK